jgi:hypothetical protein
LLELRFDDIQDDANPVFVVISDDSLMSVGRVTAHNAILFARKLSWMVRSDKPINLFLFHLHILLLLLVSHDEPSVSDQLVLRLGLLNPSVVSTTVFLV